MAKLHLFIAGKPHEFSKATVTMSIEQLAHTFDCDIVPMPITKPLDVEFKLDKETLFKGTIDGTDTTTSSNAKGLRIFGRSQSANMIDSKIKMDAVYNQTLFELLKTIAGKFGLSAKNNVTTKLAEVQEFQINAESPVSNLAQIARQQNLMIYESNGSIVIEKPGQFEIKNIRLEDSKNLTGFSIQRNWSDLFYHIEVQGAYDDSEASITYAPANSYRTKVIIADKLQDSASCKSRAEYERDLAIAKGLTISGTVPGLHSQLGINAINKIMEVYSAPESFHEKLLLKSLTLNVEGNSENTQISLFRPFSEVLPNESA
ncbi:MAG: phage tail protein [Thiomicrospira sp.]|nr:MAG: phage tail protein [Thiomicrospira sp.]